MYSYILEKREMSTWESTLESHKAQMSAMYLASNPTFEQFLELKRNLKSADERWMHGFLEGGGFEVGYGETDLL